MVITMAKSVTIDSFPLDLVQWLPQTTPSDSHHPNASSIFSQTSLCVIEPTRPYLTNLFGQHKQKSWADIFPPHDFHTQSDRFFHHTILPGFSAAALLKKYDAAVENLTLENIEFCPVAADKILECLETINTLEIELGKILAKILQYKKG